MSSAHPHEIAYRRTADAFRSADHAALASLIDGDVVWHVPGRHAMAGDIRGRGHSSYGSASCGRRASGSPSTMYSATTSTSARSAPWAHDVPVSRCRHAWLASFTTATDRNSNAGSIPRIRPPGSRSSRSSRCGTENGADHRSVSHLERREPATPATSPSRRGRIRSR
jgi:hypothetical protein